MDTGDLTDMAYYALIMADAHFDKVDPKTDLVFIDYANFLQKIWENVGLYLQVTPV